MSSRTASSLEMGEVDEGTRNSMGRRCYKNRMCYSIVGGIALLVFIIVLSSSWDTIAPTQFGLLKNGVTGAVDLRTVYRNGRHFVGPTQRFLHFPANLVTLSYGNRSNDDQTAIPARTGAAAVGESSGGQPVSLSVSFQYQLNLEKIPPLYETFGELWETSYLRFAQQAITNVAQSFTPRDFWTSRRHVEMAMRDAVNRSLWSQGFASVPTLQLRAVGFQRSYEQTITNIQLQEQLRVTKSYQLEVTRVNKMVDLMQSETDAAVVAINADAARQEAIVVGEANAAALQTEQRAKAGMYARMIAHLGWSTEELLQYVKMRALNGQPQQNVVVGVTPVSDTLPLR